MNSQYNVCKTCHKQKPNETFFKNNSRYPSCADCRIKYIQQRDKEDKLNGVKQCNICKNIKPLSVYKEDGRICFECRKTWVEQKLQPFTKQELTC